MLTVNHLSALNTHLRCVAQKWQTLGSQLGLTTEMLATLADSTSEGKYDPAIYLSKVLSTWLQLVNPPATLEALCGALSHATVGEEKLAQSLYGRFIVAFKFDITVYFSPVQQLQLTQFKQPTLKRASLQVIIVISVHNFDVT